MEEHLQTCEHLQDKGGAIAIPAASCASQGWVLYDQQILLDAALVAPGWAGQHSLVMPGLERAFVPEAEAVAAAVAAAVSGAGWTSAVHSHKIPLDAVPQASLEVGFVQSEAAAAARGNQIAEGLALAAGW